VNVDQRVKVMEEELKILKNEMQTVLLDIREQYLNLQNPFNSVALMEAKEQTMAAVEELKNAKDQVDRAKERADIIKDKAEAAAEKVEMAKDAMAGMPATQTKATVDNPNNAGQESVSNLSNPPSENQVHGRPVAVETPAGTAGEFPGLAPADIKSAGFDFANAVSSQDGEAEFKEDNEHNTDSGIFIGLNSGKKSSEVKGKEPVVSEGSRFDLIVVAGLAQWVESAVARLGKERVEALVEVSHSMGRLPLHFKDLLIKLARLSKAESRSCNIVTARDYLMLLTQLEDLVGETQPHDRALLSILSNDGGSAWTR
jgi:hypothetical protein